MAKSIILETKNFVRKQLEGEGTGHDWWHIERVWKNAKKIAGKEGGDLLVIELGALLHDIADWKFHGGDLDKSARVAEKWLASRGLDSKTIDKVKEAIGGSGFGKQLKTKISLKSLEAKIVQDADRLEALGAIGIARAFAYGGHKGRPIYDPEQKLVLRKPAFSKYKKGAPSTLHHFYDKLLHLKGMMHTKTAKQIAARRHTYIQNFLKEFKKEWTAK